MKIVKILTIGAVLFITGLIITCCFVEHPLDNQYEQTIKVMMEKGNYPSEAAVLQTNPELLKIKNQIHHIKQLKAEISDFSRGKPMAEPKNIRIELNEKLTMVLGEQRGGLSQSGCKAALRHFPSLFRHNRRVRILK